MKTKDYKKEMISILEKLGVTHDIRETWCDYLTMFSCSLSNLFDNRFYEEREKAYLNCVKKYDQEELSQFVTLASLAILALVEKPEQDFLGVVYTDLGLCCQAKQQYFTSYPVARAMSEMTASSLDKLSKETPFISVADPCCGSGCMLIAFANTAQQKGFPFQDRILYVAQDLDQTAALMCYIQLSLLGCAGIIKIGDSLTDPITDHDMQSNKLWFTPYYFSDIWATNRNLGAGFEIRTFGNTIPGDSPSE